MSDESQEPTSEPTPESTTVTAGEAKSLIGEGVAQFEMTSPSRLALLGTKVAKKGGETGTPISELQTSEAWVIKIIADDSVSIANAKKTHDIAQGFDAFVGEWVKKEEAGASVLIGASYMSKGPICAFTSPSTATRIGTNYIADRDQTLLRDSMLEGVAEITLKAGEARGERASCYSVLVILTDGEDNGSGTKIEDLRVVIDDYRKTGRNQIIAVCVDNGETNFVQEFTNLGLDPQYILVCDPDHPGDIVAKCRRASQLSNNILAKGAQAAAAAPAAAGDLSD